MLISITECKGNGIWTGRPDLGYWCNTEPASAALTSNTQFVPQMQFLNKHFSLLGWNEGEEAVQIHQNEQSEQQAEKD